jgi:hypothetical protein
MRTILFLLAFFVTFPLQAADFYCIVFSHDSNPRRAAESHNFATFIKVEERAIVEQISINWGPIGEYRFGDGKVKGVNRTLKEALENAKSGGKVIKSFGPYKITPTAWDLAVKQKAYLDSGKVAYQVTDRVTALDLVDTPGIPAINCIHAITDIGGNLVTGGKFGEVAAAEIVDFYKRRGLIVDKSEFYSWINKELEVDSYILTGR